MVQFLKVYQVTDNNYIYLNFGLISRIKPTNNSATCDYNIYMADGFSTRVQRAYRQNIDSIEELDNIFRYSEKE